MRFKMVAAGAVIALISVASASGALQKGGNSLHATLTGKAEVPKGDPDGRGTAEVKINGRSVCWEIKASRVTKLLAAHIHKGRAGVAGPIVVPFGNTFKAKGCVTAPARFAAAIKSNPGAYYVNVHNAKYPGGALRGQLRSDD
jgi:CHRD domain